MTKAPPESGETQHERASEIPLVTDSGHITAVEALDEHREGEVRDAVDRILGEHGIHEDVETDDELDWDAVDEAVEGSDLPDTDRDKLDTLRDRYERPYPSLVEVSFSVEHDEIDFVPGQYVTVHYHDTPRPYSVASSPNEENISLCIRRVPGGHLTPDLLEHADEREDISVRGPNGDFTLQEVSSRDMLFIATGTGVAPLRSMIRYTFEEGRDEADGEARDVWLVQGTSWRDDVAYREEFRSLAEEHDNFHFVPTLSRESILTNWDGETPYVQHTFLKYLNADAVDDHDLDDDQAEYLDADPAYDVDARMDPSDLEVYACGVSAMVNTLEGVCAAVGVPDDAVASEGFG